ncbi:ATP-binding protein [Paraburkholderia aromaticivorans]
MPNKRAANRHPPKHAASDLGAMVPAEPEGIDDTAWLGVIHKMDEVYAQLVRDEIALEEKNSELEQSQQFIFSVLSSMSDVLIACNCKGEIQQTNDALCQLVQMADKQLRGQSIYTLLADDQSAAKVRSVIGSGARTAAGHVVELNLADAAGRAVPAEVSCTPRLGPRGRCVGYVFVGRPMGELKAAYHQLREAHEELKQTQQQLLHAEKLASMGRLVAGIAHELNNPISFVLGNLHALKRYSERLAIHVEALQEGHDAAALEQQRRDLRIDHILEDLPSLIDATLQGAQRTADVVQGLKRFSAVDRDEHRRFDLNDVIERAVLWVTRGTAPAFDVQCELLPACYVMGSSGQMLQVIMNLIQNAYDAASCKNVRAPMLAIRAQHADGRVVLSFHDNGPGIADEHLAHVFDPFFSTKPVGKGTGLGLSISYGIVERHGGHLAARNHPDGGGEFLLELPLADSDSRDLRELGKQ